MARKKPTIQETEKQIPALAKTATRSAYKRAVSSGSVLISANGEIRRIESDGTSRFVKTIPSQVKVEKGAVIKIK